MLRLIGTVLLFSAAAHAIPPTSYYCWDDTRVYRYHTTSESGRPQFALETPETVIFEVSGSDAIRREPAPSATFVNVTVPGSTDIVGLVLPPIDIPAVGAAVDFDTFAARGPRGNLIYEKVRCHSQHLYW